MFDWTDVAQQILRLRIMMFGSRVTYACRGKIHCQLVCDYVRQRKKGCILRFSFCLWLSLDIFHISFPHHRSRILRMPKVSKIIIRIDVNFSPLSDNKCAVVSFSIRMVSSLAIDAKFSTFSPRRSNSIKLGLGEGVPCLPCHLISYEFCALPLH